MRLLLYCMNHNEILLLNRPRDKYTQGAYAVLGFKVGKSAYARKWDPKC